MPKISLLNLKNDNAKKKKNVEKKKKIIFNIIGLSH
jgi:hypothetical protein